MGTSYGEEQNKEALRNATFLQGVAASAVAFTLHEVASWHSLQSVIIAGLAVIAFGFSFYYGILYSHAVQRFYMLGAISSDRTAKSEERRQAKSQHGRAKRMTAARYRWQLRWLLVGSIVYFVATGVQIKQTNLLAAPAASK